MAGGGRRLSAQDWANAALRALETGGLAAVAVEPLAKRLHTTKGSFYWHFRNRDALIEAALQRWEQRDTDEIISQLDEQPDPVAALRRLFAQVIEFGATERIELSLLASADHPLVAPVLERVSQRRIDYVRDLFRAAGLSQTEARDRAVVAVSVYLGFTQLTHSAPKAMADTVGARRSFVAATQRALLADLD